ncbi:hypothetical protein U8C30_10160 (plasmid) [Sinorhizobium meliloti]|nr:hypothetical protein U8C30_10160 [Sinorhizobium meliloti]
MPDMKTTIIGALLALSVAGAATARAEEVLRFATWDTGESLAIQQAIAKNSKRSTPA